MTIVELYDEKPINNIVGALAFNTDKVIYVGGYSKKQFDSKKLPVLKNYYECKGFSSLSIEYVHIKRDSLSDIISKLESIHSCNEECKFHVEITGGEDLILIGLGVLCQRYPEIELYQISSKLRTIRSFSVNNDDGKKLDINCQNTVEENLRLHGASIISANGSNELPDGFVWDIEFFHDVDIMWNICCKGVYDAPMVSAPNSWNKVTMALSRLDEENENRKDSNRICVTKSHFKSGYLQGDEGELFYDYICFFVRNNLMDCRFEDNDVVIDFKNDQVRLCLTKAGLILELKTYLVCSELVRSRDGDCKTGVTIDWDGDEDISSPVKYLSNPNDPDSTIDTTNEIDVLANCGLVPYFISCKNGKFTSEELYKLYSVGERFGKGYCKKIIVTTNMSYALGGTKNAILQRAADMGIAIIDDVYKMTSEQFSSALSKAMELPKIKIVQQS